MYIYIYRVIYVYNCIYIYVYNCKYIYIYIILYHDPSKILLCLVFQAVVALFSDLHEVIEDHDRWISAAQDEEVAMDFIGIR